MSIAFVFAVLSGTLLFRTPVAEESESPLPATLATIQGERATLADYQNWLVDVQGAALLNQYFDEVLLLRASRDRGCAVSDAEVHAAFETEWSTIVKLRFQGDENAFLDELRTGGHSKDTYRIARGHSIRSELTLDRLCALDRDVSEATLRERFAREYGTPPERLTVRLLRINRFSLEQARVLNGEPRSQSQSELESRAEAHAKTLLERLGRGEDFAALAKQNSHDLASASQGGRIEHLSAAAYGISLVEAARALTADKPQSGLIKEPSGYAILRIESRTPLQFEEMRDTLIQQIRAEPSDAATRAATLEKLHRTYPIERNFKP